MVCTDFFGFLMVEKTKIGENSCFLPISDVGNWKSSFAFFFGGGKIVVGKCCMPNLYKWVNLCLALSSYSNQGKLLMLLSVLLFIKQITDLMCGSHTDDFDFMPCCVSRHLICNPILKLSLPGKGVVMCTWHMLTSSTSCII